MMKCSNFIVILFLLVGLLMINCEKAENPLMSSDQDKTADNTNMTLMKGGFDQYGYNYNARLFNGLADGVDRKLDGTYWGNTTYANDHLNMKWSKAWDNARFHGVAWNPDAWTTNHWNGQCKNGSGEVWHYKIIWVGPELEESPYWRPGGYPIWGQFEVIMSHGTYMNQHFWDAHAKPLGF